ncbi:MAG: type II toxin-antitoxin system RelE/ParE family toxin [Methanobacteriaceae archaeon]|nr:type II toxin-antitoxin system RelE/ParE family toxin [Candidatus Methanorudis spinitermitis]
MIKDMDYEVIYSPQSDKYLKKLSKRNKKDLIMIKDAIHSIPKNLHNSKLLKGQYKGFRRIKKDPYRIIFKIKVDTSLLSIFILEIGKRENVYK